MMKHNRAIPVLMYHHVNPAGNFINARPELFESHIRFLKQHGYTTLRLSEFLAALREEITPPQKSILITFDDGWLDNWLFAYPILKKYDMRAVIFVVTSLIHDNGRRMRSDEGQIRGLPPHKECERMVGAGSAREVMLSWEEIMEMEKGGLIDIQSHTHTHRRWDKLYPHQQERMAVLQEELRISKEIIENKLRKQPIALCWPWGKYDKDYVDAAMSSGYKLLFTTEKGTNTCGTEPWRVKRVVVGNIGNFSFGKKLFIYSRAWLTKTYLKYFK